MATPAEVAALRPLINDAAEPFEFDNPTLSAQIDAAGSDLRKAAGAVWGIKAAKLAGLVDVSEGSSSRKLGQLYKQALEMSTYYAGEPAGASSSTRRSGTRAIVRLT